MRRSGVHTAGYTDVKIFDTPGIEIRHVTIADSIRPGGPGPVPPPESLPNPGLQPVRTVVREHFSHIRRAGSPRGVPLIKVVHLTHGEQTLTYLAVERPFRALSLGSVRSLASPDCVLRP